ncbi:YkuS family protein [Desulfofundulus thermocisternus]|jgi:malonyl CoA-acyl carrier protein transacylase|uniref:YkuS family protein n=1 Tax=Desulfofundulus thermocisternus TaxID=42471 RepID=UPI00054F8EB1|nr:YkuS family protein [Desulfofundulus thermocisternus]
MKIAVQDNLEEVKNYLASQGYEVVSPANALGAAAMVITGDMDAREEEQTLALATNPTITNYAPVINAAGKSPEQILQKIREIAGEKKS